MLSLQGLGAFSRSSAAWDCDRPFKTFARPLTGAASSPTPYPAYVPPLPSSASEPPPSRRRSDPQTSVTTTSSALPYPYGAMDFRHPSYENSIMDISDATPNRLAHLHDVPIKSELDAMSCASGMPSVTQPLSHDGHGYTNMAAPGGGHVPPMQHQPPHTPHMMGHHERPKMHGDASGAGVTSSAALASGDSPPMDPMAGQPSSTTSVSGAKVPPKKRPLSVPEDMKDSTYWEKRKKNNESAKRSREARRMKEEQIAMRVVYLEQENLQLRTEVSLLKSEIEKLRCMLYNS